MSVPLTFGAIIASFPVRNIDVVLLMAVLVRGRRVGLVEARGVYRLRLRVSGKPRRNVRGLLGDERVRDQLAV